MAKKSKTLHTSGRWALLTFRRIRLALGICALLVLSSSLAGPPQPGLAAGPSAVSAGGTHTCAVTGIAMISAGGVKCWGLNIYGQIGDGTTTDRSTPVTVTGLTSGVASVSAGEEHTCAVTMGGGVKCWGWNASGQLGNGTSSGPETCYVGNPCSRTPVDVSGLTSVAAISAGGFHTCALTTSGGVKCWGSNSEGELGGASGDSCGGNPCATTPLDVTGLTSGVAAVSAGYHHTCALKDGGIKCWGAGYGSTPVDIPGLASGVDAVSAGTDHTCALIGGAVKCWGLNASGQLGNGTTTDSSTPVDVCNIGKSYPCGSNVLTGVTALSAGSLHTCARRAGGGIRCWGDNGLGELGDGTTNGPEICGIFACSRTPVDVCNSGKWFPCGSNVLGGAAAISAGDFHTCALTSGGGVKCWGWGPFGQLGDGTSSDSEAPVHVLMDNDMDGCLDSRELQTAPGSEMSGGRRNPKSFWDFMEQWTGGTRDRVISAGDIAAVVARYGKVRPGGAPTKAIALAEALTPPTDTTSYHASADRNGSGGPYLWSMLPPDGSISGGDIGAVVAQYGDSCA